MSDDDERMERANRIRRMREGQRSGDDADEAADTDEAVDADTDEDADANTDESDAPAQTGANDVSEEPEAGDSSTHSEGEPADTAAPDDTEATAATEQTGARTDEADGQKTDSPEQQARADGSEQPQEDSMNESSSTSETDASSDTDEDAPDPQAIAQRAAQAASEVAGAESGTVADATESAGEPAGDDASVGETAAAMQGATGVELPDQEEIDAAIEAAGGSAETADAIDTADDPTDSGPGTLNAAASTGEDTTRVLEFTLGDEHYCIDISLVEEIVKRDSITRVPNTDEYIEGVVDLRGQITTILDPKALMDIDAEGSETLMIVFDPDAFDDQGAIGWIVDEVRQVSPISESEVNQPPVDEDYIRGVVDRDDSEAFVIWTKPAVAIELATSDETDD